MFEFLKSRRPHVAHPPSVAPVSVAPHSTQQHSNVQRELIRVVLKDTLRVHGIPSGWLACEVIIITRPNSEKEFHIQLVVMKWREQLLRYAPALQQQLVLALQRLDLSVGHSSYLVSWRFSPDCGCPFTAMPDPKFWFETASPAADEEPISVLDRRHSRRPLNAARLDPAPPGPQDQPSSFATTQIAPLR